ncbi:hypothetical protein CEP53_008442 [Fusarium sp. AF-6]|nr:hypothetical protein CEP53_008442 [Fusarium sp. AF-6]
MGSSCDHGLSPLAITDVLERLSENPEVRDEILTQLEDICEAADDLLDIILGNRENRDLVSSPVSEEDSTDRDEAHMILEVISDSVGSLFRIAILVRRATTRDRFERALQASDLDFPPEFDIDYVREKHPKIQQSSLSARLGGAIAKRRQLISYCRDHRSRLGAEQTINDDAISRMEKTSSKATTFVPQTDLRDLEVEEDDAASFTSASTMTDSALLLRLPSLADLSPDGNPFECPICFTLQEFQREKAWKKHAFRDLKAYVCTLGGGECDNLLFGDRDSWFEHEIKNHRATYSCSLCDSARRVSKRNLRSHFATHGTFTDQQLHILEDAARDTRINLRAHDCPFCDEWADKLGARSVTSTRDDQDVVVSHVRFKRHVATHQEQLAIFALPRAIEEDETLRKEVDLNSNSDSESIHDSTNDKHKQYSMRPSVFSRLGRAIAWNLSESQDPSAPESTMPQASPNVSSGTQKNHECLLCNKEFTQPSSLQTHMHIHKGESFPCFVKGCGQKFFTAWDLHRHLTIHKRLGYFEAGSEDPDGDHGQNLPKRHCEIVYGSVSTRRPRATSNSVFTSDIQTSPAQQDSEPNSQIPFAVPLHPAPKTYRSQSYSVAYLDSETTRIMSSDSPVLQHPPSRPSMPSELANDDNILGKDEGVEGDDEKPGGSV